MPRPQQQTITLLQYLIGRLLYERKRALPPQNKEIEFCRVLLSRKKKGRKYDGIAYCKNYLSDSPTFDFMRI